jgi:preprotein translocase subunit SecE
VNRQTKRQMARQGTDPRAPGGGGRGRGGTTTGTGGGRGGGRRGPAPQTDKERTGPRQYINEVRGEMRKVAWPTRREVITSSIVVLVAVTFMTLLIFGYDYVSAKFVLFLFD